MKFIELDCIYNKEITIRLFGKKIITFKKLYKFFKRVLSHNIKYNILFKINPYIFPLEYEFYKSCKSTNIKLLEYNLIKNLDSSSIKTVQKIIYRIKSLFQWKKFLPFIKFFDNDEIKYYNRIIEMWNNSRVENNIRIIDNKYKFENNNCYSPLQFVNLIKKHSIGNFKNINNIKNKCIIDAGAWIGDSALVLSEATDKNVYSFECTSSTFKLLQRTVELNKKRNIIPVQMGLGNKIGKETLYTYPLQDSEGNTMVCENLNHKITSSTSEEINITTIDKFIEENNIEVGFIKADIEGMELPMLKGAINTLKTQKPALCISIYHSFNDFFFIKEFLENMNLGYKFSIIHFAKGYSWIADTCLLAEVE